MARDCFISEILNSNLEHHQSIINLIASENYPSIAVRDALSSFISYKYAEGYPGRRYYGGCEYADLIENTALDRLRQLYNVEYANVQPHSGSQANQAVFLACLKPNDTILSLSLAHGGHLTHGHPINYTGKLYNIVHYHLNDHNELDYDQISALAIQYQPKIIIAGFSCFPGMIDWQRFRYIANQVNAVLLADIAHIAGLIAGQTYPSPVEFADIITSTTHKTLRGPKGAIIMAKRHNTLTKQVNAAVFPGIQGGPFMNVIAAKAIAFEEALSDEFKRYCAQIIKNSKAMLGVFQLRQIPLVFQNTENHIIVLSLDHHPLSGKDMELVLEQAHIITNRNAIPKDRRSFLDTSGIRIGTQAVTTRGMKEEECIVIAHLISDLFQDYQDASVNCVRDKIKIMATSFPVSQ